VQQRLEMGVGIEITGFAPEADVGREHRREREAASKQRELGRHEQQRGRERGYRHHRKESRQQAPDAPLVEAQNRKPPLADVGVQQAGDDEAGNDKEHVHADEAARGAQAGMEEQDGQHGHGPQTVDVGPVIGRGIQARPCVVRAGCKRTGGTGGGVSFRRGGLSLSARASDPSRAYRRRCTPQSRCA
jgi:hypothetical protein